MPFHRNHQNHLEISSSQLSITLLASETLVEDSFVTIENEEKWGIIQRMTGRNGCDGKIGVEGWDGGWSDFLIGFCSSVMFSYSSCLL